MLKERHAAGPRARPRHDRRDARPGKLTLVHAYIRGTEQPEHEVLITGHLDHPKWSANDNASGSGALIEMRARCSADRGRRSSRRRADPPLHVGARVVRDAAYLSIIPRSAAAALGRPAPPSVRAQGPASSPTSTWTWSAKTPSRPTALLLHARAGLGSVVSGRPPPRRARADARGRALCADRNAPLLADRGDSLRPGQRPRSLPRPRHPSDDVRARSRLDPPHQRGHGGQDRRQRVPASRRLRMLQPQPIGWQRATYGGGRPGASRG